MSDHVYRRRRPAVVCIECRRRKVKCDRLLPCGPCCNASLPCGYRNPNSIALTDPPAGPTATNLSIISEGGAQAGAVFSSSTNPNTVIHMPSSSGSGPPTLQFPPLYTSPRDAGINEPVDLPGRTVSHAKSFGCGKQYIQSSFGQVNSNFQNTVAPGPC